MDRGKNVQTGSKFFGGGRHSRENHSQDKVAIKMGGFPWPERIKGAARYCRGSGCWLWGRGGQPTLPPVRFPSFPSQGARGMCCLSVHLQGCPGQNCPNHPCRCPCLSFSLRAREQGECAIWGSSCCCYKTHRGSPHSPSLGGRKAPVCLATIFLFKRQKFDNAFLPTSILTLALSLGAC